MADVRLGSEYASAPHVFHKTYQPPETSSETYQISKMELS